MSSSSSSKRGPDTIPMDVPGAGAARQNELPPATRGGRVIGGTKIVAPVKGSVPLDPTTGLEDLDMFFQAADEFADRGGDAGGQEVEGGNKKKGDATSIRKNEDIRSSAQLRETAGFLQEDGICPHSQHYFSTHVHPKHIIIYTSRYRY